MANTKKYISLDKLGLYDEKIKGVVSAGDAAALKVAKDYADSLASNYEVAGSSATVQGKLDEEAARAKAKEEELAGSIATAQGEVDALETVVAGKANASDLEALASKVGELPEGTTAKDVVDYVNIKTAGIATDAALGELQSQLSGVQGEVATIKGDYLKEADKTELATAIANEKTRAEGIESGLRTDVDAIKGDYLKAEDKTELANAISAEAETARAAEKANADAIKAIADDYLKGADKTELQGNITTNAEAIAAIKEDVDAFFKDADMTETAKETLKDIQGYISEHTAEAGEMTAAIQKNKEDIAAHVATDHDFAGADATLKAELEGKINGKVAQGDFDAVEGRVDVLEGEMDTVEGKVSTLEGQMTTVQGAVATKAEAQALTDAVAALEHADAGLAERLDDVEAMLGDGDNSVADMIATAKQEAIDAAATDASNKDAVVLSEAQKYADAEVGKDRTRLDALEAKAHEHANKTLLDTYTQTEANLADAVAKKHEHSNLSILEAVTAAKVAAWDAAEQAAKTYADGLNSAMDTRMVAVETWQANMIECSQEDINNLFKA